MTPKIEELQPKTKKNVFPLKNNNKISGSTHLVSSFHSGNTFKVQTISANKNGEYVFTKEMLNSSTPQEFYDGPIKIASWHINKEGALCFESVTAKKINLVANITADKCIIKTQGPLVIDAELIIKKSLQIKSDLLYLNHEVRCDGTVLLTAKQSIDISGNINTKHLTVETGCLNQNSQITANGQYDVTAQTFQQGKHSKTNVLSLRIIAETCGVDGELTVTGDCFVAANRLVFGHKDLETTIKLQGETHIHVMDCRSEGDTEVTIKTPSNKQPSQFIVDGNLFIDNQTTFDISHADFEINEINNSGELLLNDCVMTINQFQQGGLFDCYKSTVKINKQFTQQGDAVTKVEQSAFASKANLILSGQFCLSHSEYVGDQCHVSAGHFLAERNSAIHISEWLLFDEDSAVLIANSKIYNAQETILDGDVTIQQSTLQSGWLTANKQIVKVDQSTLLTREQMIFAAGIDTQESEFQGKWVILEGKLEIDDLNVLAKSLKLSSQNSVVNRCYARTDSLTLQGGNHKDTVIFNCCDFTTKLLTEQKHVTLLKSILVGTDKSDMSHFIHGHLKLKSSSFLTQSQVQDSKQGGIEADDYSTLLTGRLCSQGMLSANRSYIFPQSLLQQQSSLKLSECGVKIKKGIFSIDSHIKISKSTLTTGGIILSGTDKLSLTQRSKLDVKNKISVGRGSVFSSDNSLVRAKSLASHGKTKLTRSSLYTRDLRIYDKFSASDKTTVAVQESITIAKRGDAKFKQSVMLTKNVVNGGTVSLDDSIAKVEKKFIATSTSETTVQGKSAIIAETARFSGHLKSKTQPHNNKSHKQQSPSPQIIVKKELEFSNESTVEGDDLSLQAKVINQEGTINLSGNLRATGKVFGNTGSTSAKNIFLGFDDYVVNWGSFSANNMVVHSNYLNLLGRVYVSENFNTSGFVSLNLGAVIANNYTSNSWLSLNAGVVLPNFSTDIKYILSPSNLFSFGKTLAITAMPQYTNLINLVAMAPSLVSMAANLYDLYQRYDLETLMSMRRHQLMPLLCQVKNAAIFGCGALTTAKYVATNGLFQNQVPIWDLWKTGKQMANIFGGSYTDNSLFFANFGTTVALATSRSNVIDFNGGVEFSMLSQNTNTHFLYNYGISGSSGENTILATAIDNSGRLYGNDGFTLTTNLLHNRNSGSVYGKNANMTIDHLHQEGNFTLEQGRANIDVFSDAQAASTVLEKMQIKGTDFDLRGSLNATETQFNIEDHFHTAATANVKTENVSIITHDFSHFGEWYYKHLLTVYADSAALEKGSEFTGEKTAVDELFVDVDPEPESDAHANEESATAVDEPNAENKKKSTEGTELGTDIEIDAETKKPKQQRKPNHVAIFSANKIRLDGHASGGDYMIIKGKQESNTNSDSDKTGSAMPTPKAEEITFGESAKVEWDYGEFAAEETTVSGKVNLKNFHIDSSATKVSENSTFSLVNSFFEGKTLQSDGNVNLDHVEVEIDNINFTLTAKEHIKQSLISSKSVKDDGEMSCEGAVMITTDEYYHRGSLRQATQSDDFESENFFALQAKKAELVGSSDISSGYFEIDELADRIDFITGQGKYSNYQCSDSFAFVTPDNVELNQSIERDCDITVKAASVDFSTDYNKNFNLNFISTEGNVQLTGNISNKNLYVSSANDILANNSIYTTEAISFEAQGGCYNLGGTINGDIVAIKAKEIKNITPGSQAAKEAYAHTNSLKYGRHHRKRSSWSWLRHRHQDTDNDSAVKEDRYAIAMGDGGVINGRTNASLEATNGNIENHGGVIRAGEYLQLIASDDVYNICNVRTYRGQYDTIKQFEGALMVGGNGSDTDGIGLYIQAGGEVKFVASDAFSNGDIYIEGFRGVDFEALTDTHVSKDVTTSKYCGFKKRRTIETTTTVRGSRVHSTNGRNIIRADEGEINSVASQFTSPGGSDLYSKYDIKLYSLVTTDRHYKSKSSGWGLIGSERDESHQNATPTLIYDNGLTRIHSVEGNADLRGAYIIGNGDLYVKAGKKILFGVDILDHEIYEKSRSLGVSMPGMAGFKTLKNGGSYWDAVTAEDATLAKLSSLSNSSNATELLTSSVNLGIDLVNTTSSIMRGIAGDSLGAELMSRYGLGGADGFAPQVTVSLTQTTIDSKYQTLGTGGVDRGGNIKLEAGEAVVLTNGVRVHAGGDMEVDAPEFYATAAALNSSFKQETMSISVSFTPAGVTGAGVAYSKTTSESVNFVNAELSADGNLTMHYQDGAMATIELNGANIDGVDIYIDTDRLIIIDKQDTSETNTISASLNSSGQWSAYKGKGHSKIVNQTSGISASGNLNGKAKNVRMTGGKVVAEGKVNLTVDKLVAIQLHDEKEYNGSGISGGVNDLKRLIGSKPSNKPGEQAIATVSLTMDKETYRADRTAVINGKGGTNLDVDHIEGTINTKNQNEIKVIKDKSTHVRLDVPITNSDYLNQTKQNIQNGTAKIAAKMGFFSKPKTQEKQTKSYNLNIKRIPGEGILSVSEDTNENENNNDKDNVLENESLLDKLISDQEISQEAITALSDSFGFSREEAENILRDSPGLTLELDRALATQEPQESGKLSAEGKNSNDENLGKPFVNAALKVVDEIITNVGDKIINEVGGKPKAAMIVLAYMVRVALNLPISGTSKDGANKEPLDQLYDAAGDALIATGIGAGLRYTLGELAGPVGWSLLGLGILYDRLYDLDERYYNQDTVNKTFENSIKGHQNADNYREQGDWFASIGARQSAHGQFDSAARAQAWHYLIQSPTYLKQLFFKAQPKRSSNELTSSAEIKKESVSVKTASLRL